MKKTIAKQVIVPMAVIVLISAFLVSWGLSWLQVTRERTAARRDAQNAAANLLDALGRMHERAIFSLNSGMQTLQGEARRMGPASLGPERWAGSGRAPDLLFGGVSQGRLMKLMEPMSVVADGIVSVFSRRGADLVRLSTNVPFPDGARAVGMVLDPAGAACRALSQGRAYRGPTDLFGNRYYAYFEPIRNVQGAMIGAFAIGYPVVKFSRLYPSVRRVRILEGGFLALVDADGQPLMSGGSLAPEAIRTLFRSGRLAGAGWEVQRRSFEPWGVTVMAAYPEQEIDRLAWLIRWGTLGCALVLVGALTLSHYYVLRKNLLEPLGDVLGVLDGISFYKQYAVRFRRQPEGEIGTLTGSLNGMLDQIQARDAQLLDYQEHLEELVVQRLDQLRQTQRLLSATLDALPVYIAILDGDGRIVLTNQPWAEATRSVNPFMAGAEVGDDYRARCQAVGPGELRGSAGQILAVLAGHQETARLDYDLELDQRRQWFTVLATRFVTQETPRVVLMHQNVTERRLMEIQLQQAQKLESIGQLAAGIAHEINTPTQFIGDNTIFLRGAFQELWRLIHPLRRQLEGSGKGACPPELVHAAQEALDQADLDFLEVEIPKAISQSMEGIRRVSSIVSAMKDFSHPGGSSRTPTDLNRAIESTSLVCQNEWRYVAELELDLDPQLGPVPCFPDQFNQVILNLILNAAHAIADAPQAARGGKGLIKITTRSLPGCAQISVADSGTGIAEAIRSRIFDPFFTTKPVGRGTGQGLAIAHAVIVDRHGGSIDLESTVGLGATFILRLPFPGDPLPEGASGRLTQEGP